MGDDHATDVSRETGDPPLARCSQHRDSIASNVSRETIIERCTIGGVSGAKLCERWSAPTQAMARQTTHVLTARTTTPDPHLLRDPSGVRMTHRRSLAEVTSAAPAVRTPTQRTTTRNHPKLARRGNVRPKPRCANAPRRLPRRPKRRGLATCGSAEVPGIPLVR